MGYIGDNLKFTINGEEVLGEWLPIEHPANGKAAEGFVYLVSFNPKKAYSQFSNGTEIVIENQAYPNVSMVYTGTAYASEPYVIKSSTLKIFGRKCRQGSSRSKRWSRPGIAYHESCC